ncbi:glucan 1,3-beta-glucosidase precursor [Paramyrothecium foliicola]|nr:glucan 1,3-beta-glucosidase precursor [Paramyrothecium foliicola]
MRRLCRYVAVWIGSTAISGVQAAIDWDGLIDTVELDPFPAVFQQAPPEPPDYMVDNTGNKRGVAPVHGKYNGPVWLQSGSFENYMEKLAEKKAAGLIPHSTASGPPTFISNQTLTRRQDGNFWVPRLNVDAPGQILLLFTVARFYPLVKATVQDWNCLSAQNVQDYGADPHGTIDATEAINAAIMDGDRCGMKCGNTFTLGALIYFPGGMYKVCSPIIQLYLTQFVGDPNDRPIIKGCDTFKGIALIDVDPYIPNQADEDGRGVNWYVNQNQFFRQIRNFVFDLTEMPLSTDEHGQKLAPTGIHWQVSQACSLQNLLFKMPIAGSSDKPPTHVGVFTENGSGGFVSDLEFEGGAIGWRVGSQQYTATSLKFRNCITAVQMVWDWGFNWHKIDIEGGTIAFNISGRGGIDGQGIGSVSIIDSSIRNVPIGILTNNHPTAPPNIVIDNTDFTNIGSIVQVENGETLLGSAGRAATTVDLWAHGRRYIGGKGERVTGHVTDRPEKPEELLDESGKLFTRLRPQYENLPPSAFLIATSEGCKNDGTGDNAEAINKFLRRALDEDKVAYFPAGIYTVKSTVTFPEGSRIQGSGWSQIQAMGDYFGDMEKPKVVVRVGVEGDVGSMEIVDMLFTVRGPTAGAIMMEWNVHQGSQGAAGLWDSHIRVGGGIGTDLDVATCPKHTQKDACICVSMLLHVTKKASGYFENFWAWVADHDNDKVVYLEAKPEVNQISLFGARGVLIESQGPVWIYGSGSEHVIFYQYQLLNAKNVYLGHIQTESPYFQPKPVSPIPMEKALGVFPGDPDWSDCTKETCEMAWGLRIIDSEDILLHSAGLYSWFQNYNQQCLKTENCQERVMEVRGSKGVSIFNIFSKAVEKIGSGETEDSTIDLEGNQQGYTSEVSLWFPEEGEPKGDIIYIGPDAYKTHTAQCPAPPCVFVMPPTTLSIQTTITFDPFTTVVEVGATQGGAFVVKTTTLTLTIAPITTKILHVSNHDISRSQTPGAPFWVTPSLTLSPLPVPLTKPDGVVTTRTLTLPPWPQIKTFRPDSGSSGGSNGATTGGGTSKPSTGGTTGGITTRPSSTKTITFPPITTSPPETIFPCYPSVHWIPENQAKITLSGCSGAATTLPTACPTTATVSIEENTNVDFVLGCTRWTGTSEPIPTITEFPPGYEVEWIEEDGETDNDDKTSTCKLWFFNICIRWRVSIRGWRWKFPGPIVIIGPPPIKWPPGVDIKGKLPEPWPPITFGRDGKPTFPPNQPSNCETQTAEICSTSTLLVTSTSQGRPITITSQVTSTCDTLRACVLTDGNYDTTRKTGSTCGQPARALRTGMAGNAVDDLFVGSTANAEEKAVSQTTSAASGTSSIASDASSPAGVNNREIDARGNLARRSPPQQGRDHYMFWMKNPASGGVNDVKAWLRGTETDATNRPKYDDFKEVVAKGWEGNSDGTLLIFVRNMQECHAKQLNEAHGDKITDSYGIYRRNQDTRGRSAKVIVPDSPVKRQQQRRVVIDHDPYQSWEIPAISVPPGRKWPGTWNRADKNNQAMSYQADSSFGKGQTIFVLEDDYVKTNSEFRPFVFFEDVNGDDVDVGRPDIVRLDPFDWGGEQFDAPSELLHGTGVLSKVTGWELGMAKAANLVVVRNYMGDPEDHFNRIVERHLQIWVKVLNDVKELYRRDPSQRGRVVATLQSGILDWQEWIPKVMVHRLREIFTRLDELDVVVIAAAHNEFEDDGDDMSMSVPDLMGDPNSIDEYRADNLIIVGATDAMSRASSLSPHRDWLVMAPGYDITIASTGEGGLYFYRHHGNSFAAPLVAGIVAYWRGLPNLANEWKEELKSPSNVKKLLMYMQRPIVEENLVEGLDGTQIFIKDFEDYPDDRLGPIPFIWTGSVGENNCLQDPTIHPSCPQGSLSNLQPFGAGCQQPGAGDSERNPSLSERPHQEDRLAARAEGVCVLRPDSGRNEPGKGPGPGAIGDPITFSPGGPSPTCVAGSPDCGTLCKGFYCTPFPTGVPPGRWDPQDPAHPASGPTTTPDPGPDPINEVPDCLFIHLSQYSGVESRRTLIRPQVIYSSYNSLCSSAVWCGSTFTGPNGNPLCGRTQLECSKTPANFISVDTSQTAGWADITLSGESFPTRGTVYIGIPEDKEQATRTSCPGSTGLSKEKECELKVYAAYIADGVCDNPVFKFHIKLGIAKKMTRQEASENGGPPPVQTTSKPSSSSTAAGPGPTDNNAAECNRCSNALGASNCAEPDRKCLLDECRTNPDCQKCKFDCEKLFDTTNPDGPECRQCADDLGASNCPPDDDGCLVTQCLSDWYCNACKFDCNGLRGPA